MLPDAAGTNDVLVRDLEATAVGLAYGPPCNGGSPIPAQAEPIGQPFVGNAAFRVGVCNGYPSALSMLAVSVASASTPVGSCTIALGGSVLLLGGTFTDVFGYASESLPIPVNPGLVGVTV